MTARCLTLALLLSLARPVSAADAPAAINISGTIEPQVVVNVVAQVPGEIQSFGVDSQDPTKPINYGSLVKRGTILLQLDPTDCQVAVSKARSDLQRAIAEVDLANAQLEAATVEQQRQNKLGGNQQSTPADVASANAVLASAKARLQVQLAGVEKRKIQLQQAEADLEHCTIRSPVDGAILDLHSFPRGQRSQVNVNDLLFRVADDSKNYQIRAQASADDVPRIHAGQPARFKVDAFPNKSFTGRVTRTSAPGIRVNNEVRYDVLVEVSDNADLLPYMTANVEIAVGDGK